MRIASPFATSVLLVSLASSSLVGQNRDAGIGADLVSTQTRSPLELLSTLSTQSGLFTTVTASNLSDRAIKSVQFGSFVRFRDDPRAEPRLITGAVIPVDMPSGAKRTLEANLLPTETINRLLAGSRSADAQLGVLAVEFADGSRYVFDTTHGRFRGF